MKILVIDDLEKNRESAQSQLGTEHNLTIIGSYGEAVPYIKDGDRKIIEKFMNDRGFPLEDPRKSYTLGKKYPWEEAYKEALNIPGIYWDIVLTDAIMPYDIKSHQIDPGFGENKLVGYQLALNAAVRGASVAIVFSAHHHQSAEGRILEGTCWETYYDSSFLALNNGARIIFVQDTAEQGKNWKKALQKLVA